MLKFWTSHFSTQEGKQTTRYYIMLSLWHSVLILQYEDIETQTAVQGQLVDSYVEQHWWRKVTPLPKGNIYLFFCLRSNNQNPIGVVCPMEIRKGSGQWIQRKGTDTPAGEGVCTGIGIEGQSRLKMSEDEHCVQKTTCITRNISQCQNLSVIDRMGFNWQKTQVIYLHRYTNAYVRCSPPLYPHERPKLQKLGSVREDESLQVRTCSNISIAHSQLHGLCEGVGYICVSFVIGILNLTN